MMTDNFPQSSDALSLASVDESMPDVFGTMQILEKYIDDHLTGGMHDDGLGFGQSDCRLIQAALRFTQAAIERARQAGEPDPVLA